MSKDDFVKTAREVGAHLESSPSMLATGPDWVQKARDLCEWFSKPGSDGDIDACAYFTSGARTDLPRALDVIEAADALAKVTAWLEEASTWLRGDEAEWVRDVLAAYREARGG